MNTILKTLLTSVLLASSAVSFAQGGNHVFSGAESSNFGAVDLATPIEKTWSTYRGVTPGYFSAMGIASYSNPDDANHIDGYVKHYATAADQAFNFPVGSGSDYRSIAISGSISAAANIATAWIVGDPTITIDPTDVVSGGYHSTGSLGAGVVLVSDVGQWDWQDLSNNASGATVTVSIPDMSLFGLAANLLLVGWNGTKWVNLSGGSSGSSGVSENSLLSGTMINGITAIGIGSSKGVPNLSPVITFVPNNITNPTNIGVVTTIYEFNSVSTSGLITVLVKKDPKYVLAFNPISTNVFGRTVSNASWTFDAISNPTFYVLTTSDVVPADGELSVGFTTTFNTNNTVGSTPILAYILAESGGEVDDTDNADNDVLTYQIN